MTTLQDTRAPRPEAAVHLQQGADFWDQVPVCVHTRDRTVTPTQASHHHRDRSVSFSENRKEQLSSSSVIILSCEM